MKDKGVIKNFFKNIVMKNLMLFNLKKSFPKKNILIVFNLCLLSTISFAQINTHTSALLGTTSSADDCSPEHQAFNDKIMMFGRIAVSTKAFEECVREKVTDLYRKCNGDPFYDASLEVQIQKVIDIARSPNNVHIKCSGGSGNASTGIGDYGMTGDETFWWGGWFSSVYNQLGRPVCDLDGGERPNTHNCRWAAYPWPYSQAAGIAWHEVMHQQGYGHGANEQATAIVNCGYEGDATWHFQRNTMPYIIGSCVSDIISQSGSNCNLESCRGSNQLQMVTHHNGTSCECVNDPGKKGWGLLKVQNGDLVDETIKPIDDWVGGWRIGTDNDIVANGDFNNDGKDDFIVTSPWGIGVLTYDGTIWRPLVVKPNGTRFGGWNFQSADNTIRGVGDFNGDGKDDFVITSRWGIGILTLQGNSLRTLMIKPHDTWFGGWRYNATRDVIQEIADFDGDNKAEILITSAWGIGILELNGTSLSSKLAKPNGTRFGGWNFQSADNKIKGSGDFNNDGKDDFVVTSAWGIGILTLQGSSLNTLMIKPKDTWFGAWRYDASVNRGKDVIRGIGDFDGDNKADILITSSWGIGILELRSNSLFAIVAKPNGTRFGGWNFQSADNTIRGIGDFTGNGRDEFVITSRWGLGILTKSGNSLTSVDMKPNGKLFGSWLLGRTDKVALVGKFASGNRAKMFIQKK